MDLFSAGLFLLAALMLLGSPGPGIAALLAVGKERGFTGSLRFLAGLQVGIASAAAICACGLFSVIAAAPFAMRALAIAAALYLAWLAWKIASSPVGQPVGASTASVMATARGGFLLGITNPKAYIAFVSLMASSVIARGDPTTDAAVKWILCVIVVLVVDVAWLWVGAAIGRLDLTARHERLLNLVMGAAILAAAVMALVY